MTTHQVEVDNGERFEFGRNWTSFASTLTPERIRIAERSICDMLRVDDLQGKTVLDAGSGSGLFSLSARNLGASVRSFDFDYASVSCTQSLKTKFHPNDLEWEVDEGSVLDRPFLKSLGLVDIVYSWGVLHHTGNMWLAIDNVAAVVKPGGKLFIAIYTDEGWKSRVWARVKRFYCATVVGKAIVSGVFVPYFFMRTLIKCIVTGQNEFGRYKNRRGMSITHDWFDWLGGLPFEVASVHAIFEFLCARGFSLDNIHTVNGRGNNQFVFVKNSDR
jgi:2-polyprenyl-6-hydroxyphenyl methylase/3-demethylubiquinone-9 3-methyltransferase